ncbi:MAG: HNH endonuclease [Lactobacillus sp.]|nr:HNH endonuclease [Lactobacillus sp.]
MPKKRPPTEVWNEIIRPSVWYRDGGSCVNCRMKISLNECHIDHIRSGKLGTNSFSNLRTLCRRCHCLRADLRHDGMRANALKNKIIDSGWRKDAWE